MLAGSAHLLLDLLAAGASFALTLVVLRWRLADRIGSIERAGLGYAAALLLGAVLGGFALGSANLALSGRAGFGRSILGALLGGIAGVETLKAVKGIRGSTGLVFVPAFCTTVVIGRIGCHLAGLVDFTYGTPTALPWGHDYGDGIPRHPVQLYESAAMGGFLVYALLALRSRVPFFMRNGFYLMTGWYATQRYAWEFLKPYGTLAGSHNVFHLAALALAAYTFWMIARREHAHRHS